MLINPQVRVATQNCKGRSSTHIHSTRIFVGTYAEYEALILSGFLEGLDIQLFFKEHGFEVELSKHDLISYTYI